MERRYARDIGLGLLIGIAVGITVGQSVFAVALGALGGVFMGWFVAAIQMQRNSDHTPKNP